MRTTEKMKGKSFNRMSTKSTFYSYKCLKMPGVITIHFEHLEVSVL